MTHDDIMRLDAKDRLVKMMRSAVLSFTEDTWEHMIAEWVDQVDAYDIQVAYSKYGEPDDI